MYEISAKNSSHTTCIVRLLGTWLNKDARRQRVTRTGLCLQRSHLSTACPDPSPARALADEHSARTVALRLRPCACSGAHGPSGAGTPGATPAPPAGHCGLWTRSQQRGGPVPVRVSIPSPRPCCPRAAAGGSAAGMRLQRGDAHRAPGDAHRGTRSGGRAPGSAGTAAAPREPRASAAGPGGVEPVAPRGLWALRSSTHRKQMAGASL